jgi:hypothetical protein
MVDSNRDALPETTLLQSRDEQMLRSNVRNFLLTASRKEVRQEILLSLDRGDSLRAALCLEVLLEELPERTGTTLHEFVKSNDVSFVGGEHVVKVFTFDTRLHNLTDFIVVEQNSQWTRLMPDPETEITCCGECGHLGCQSGCVAYGKEGI